MRGEWRAKGVSLPH